MLINNSSMDWQELWYLVFGHRCNIQDDGCWLWVGALNSGGYPQISLRSPYDGSRHRRGHRLSYEIKNGPIPSGLVIHHTCHDPFTCLDPKKCFHRRCINPWHLEATTQQENILRGSMGLRWWEKSQIQTHCPWGHEFTEENTYYYKERRFCKICDIIRVRIHRGKAIDRYGKPIESPSIGA